MNMTTVPSNQLKAMQHEIESLKEQNASLSLLVSRYSKGMKDNLAECLKGQETIAQQAAEIGVLKIAHEAHQTNNLKMLAVLKKQAAEIEKYKALCDQMGVALDKAQFTGNPYNYHTTDALEAWRALK